MKRLRLSSIQSRFILLLAGFSMLVAVSVGVTFWSLEDQMQDARTVNLAGRQRMLVQQMRREALEIELDEAGPHSANLREAMQIYETTLGALENGGDAPYPPGGSVRLPAPKDARLKAQLATVESAWKDTKTSLDGVASLPAGSAAFKEALQTAESNSATLLAETDSAVRLYESISTQKVNRLRWVQAAFLAGAAVLLAIGAWMVRKDVIAPLNELGQTARRIGAGDLETPVTLAGADEIAVLEENFDQMRVQLLDSKVQAQAWTGQLEQRVAQRTQELEALYSVSREISSRLAIDDVLRSITQKTQELLHGDVVFLCLFNAPQQKMTLLSTSGPAQAIARRESAVDPTLASEVLAGERALRCDEGCRGYCEILSSPYRTSHIAAPLKIEQQIIGALCVGSEKPGQFGDESIAALTKLANVAAVALQNARLYEQAERLAALEERQRIAAEMHDGLAQTLSYAKLAVNQSALLIESGQEAEALQTLEKLGEALNQAVEDTRRAIASLQEVPPLSESLQESLARLAGDQAGVEWTSRIAERVVLSQQDSQQVLRVAQEALLNARRHSGGDRISLSLDEVKGEYCLTVADNGSGFDPQAPAEGNGRQHFGLNIMRARAARIAGRVEISSAPGAGTRVSLYWSARSEGI